VEQTAFVGDLLSASRRLIMSRPTRKHHVGFLAVCWLWTADEAVQTHSGQASPTGMRRNAPTVRFIVSERNVKAQISSIPPPESPFPRQQPGRSGNAIRMTKRGPLYFGIIVIHIDFRSCLRRSYGLAFRLQETFNR
jgi:hypothetical protein